MWIYRDKTCGLYNLCLEEQKSFDGKKCGLEHKITFHNQRADCKQLAKHTALKSGILPVCLCVVYLKDTVSVCVCQCKTLARV